MTSWEYEIIRSDSLERFQHNLKSFGLEGWELVAANYVLHAEENLPLGAVPARHVWIGVLKRAIE